MSIQNSIRRADLLGRFARKFLRSRRGSIAPMVALLILPLAALLGMATEGGSWYLITRAMQNAADSAVIAAATNGGNGGSDFATEGASVASSYGFTNAVNNSTVTVPAQKTYSNVTACVSAPGCYRVTITKNVQLYLMELVGYHGNTTVNGIQGQQLSAVALATLETVNAPFCLTALGNGNQAIRMNGVPNATLACDVESNGGSTCNGHKLTTGYSDSVSTTNNDCGAHQHLGAPSATDPYASLASNIPPNPCGGNYNLEPTKKKDPPLPASNMWTANSVPANPVCGDYQLQNNITISSDSVLVIENGNLDLNGFTLTTTGTAGLTIILTGTNSASFSHVIEGGGTLNISSPTSGTWSGMSIYQDPNVATQSLSYSGNSPQWDISGIVYMPKTDFTASGAVLQATNGHTCFVLVVNTILVNGTGNLFYTNPTSQCPQQGANPPTNQAYVIGELVY